MPNVNKSLADLQSDQTDQGGQKGQKGQEETPPNHDFPVLPIDQLPVEYKKMYDEFMKYLEERQPSQARLALRPLIHYYIEAKHEIPISIEVGYGKLLVLEELERLQKK
jgi:hypothetical protein